MRVDVSNPSLRKLGRLLANKGHTVRLVGGAVRDMLLGMQPKDLDLASDAPPEATIEVAEQHGLRVVPTGLQHGTVTVVVDDEPFEVTTLRRDVETDGRHAVVEYVTDFRVDASRRDFTINAMSADLATGEVHDHFGGIQDLAAGRVRFVGDAAARMEEDYLRILRLFRFRCRFRRDGSSEDDAELEAVAAAALGLRRISGERIWSEVARVLAHPNGARELDVMQRLGILPHVGLPDILDCGLASDLQRSGCSPAATLGALCGQAAAERLAERWRMSTPDKREALVAAEIARAPSADAHEWRCRLADGWPQRTLETVLRATGRDGAADAVADGVPEFPVLGRHLVAAGVQPGPEVGRILADLRQAWKASSFEMDADELLATLDAGSPPSP